MDILNFTAIHQLKKIVQGLSALITAHDDVYSLNDMVGYNFNFYKNTSPYYYVPASKEYMKVGSFGDITIQSANVAAGAGPITVFTDVGPGVFGAVCASLLSTGTSGYMAASKFDIDITIDGVTRSFVGISLAENTGSTSAVDHKAWMFASPDVLERRERSGTVTYSSTAYLDRLFTVGQQYYSYSTSTDGNDYTERANLTSDFLKKKIGFKRLEYKESCTVVVKNITAPFYITVEASSL